MKFLVTGPQGSGKTTQAKLLSDLYGLCFVDPGELMRQKAKTDTPEGKKIKADLESGDLVDDTIIAKAVKEKLSLPTCVGGFVMDGYPRSLTQLQEFNPEYDQVFYLNLSDVEAKKRLMAREREDDTEKLIEERLKNYHASTQPVIDYYLNLGILVEIDGENSIEDIFESIKHAVKIKTKLIKEPQDLEILRQSGKISAEVLQEVLKNIKPGIKLTELDKIAEAGFKNRDASPSFKTVEGYNFSTCLTVNSEVVHGLPRDITLREGDLIAVDLGAVYQGWHTDLAWTVPVGEVDENRKKFLEVGEKALVEAVKMAVEGKRIGDISATIQTMVEAANYNVVKSLAGHGVGRLGHEAPEVPTYGEFNSGKQLQEGMVLAIEVIYTNGSGEVAIKDDGWTIETTDGGLGGLFEMSVIVGKDGGEVITR